MIRTTIIVAVGLALAAMLPALPAQAQNTRSFVSGLGSDSNSCTLSAPCRTFQRAHDQTNAGGEIAVLDSAGYGMVTISKAISIVNPGGVEAGIAVPSGGIAVTIRAGPNDAVSLRGLSIEGGGQGSTGIFFNAGMSLVIQNCVVRNFQASGIALAAGVSIAVTNTLVAENGGNGIFLQPGGYQSVNAVFNRVEAYHNAQKGIGIFGNALLGDAILTAVIVDSVAAFNADGFYVQGGSQFLIWGFTNVRVNRSTTIGNSGAGLRAETAAAISVSQTDMNEHPGWVADSSSCLMTYGDNYTGGLGSSCPIIGGGVLPKN